MWASLILFVIGILFLSLNKDNVESAGTPEETEKALKEVHFIGTVSLVMGILGILGFLSLTIKATKTSQARDSLQRFKYSRSPFLLLGVLGLELVNTVYVGYLMFSKRFTVVSDQIWLNYALPGSAILVWILWGYIFYTGYHSGIARNTQLEVVKNVFNRLKNA